MTNEDDKMNDFVLWFRSLNKEQIRNFDSDQLERLHTELEDILKINLVLNRKIKLNVLF